MIAILSPAMRMHRTGKAPASEPIFMRETLMLLEKLRMLSPHQLESVLGVNASMALRAFDDHQRFSDRIGAAAAFGYYGVCYKALDAAAMTQDELLFLQDHLRILSALYGVLRPMDRLRPYRLEMQTRGLPGIPGLYGYWGDKLCRALFGETGCVLSLCSREYEKAILPHVKKTERFIRCEFLVPHEGKLLMKPTQVKTARGLMARYIVKNRIDTLEQLLGFNEGGYAFLPCRSTKELLVFSKSLYTS